MLISETLLRSYSSAFLYMLRSNITSKSLNKSYIAKY